MSSEAKKSAEGSGGTKAARRWRRLPRDPYHDEVRIVGRDGQEDHGDYVLLRLVCVPRYKTSGLSGNAWRFGFRWLEHIGSPGEREEGRDLAGDYGSVSAACAALYPALYRAHQELHQLPVVRVEYCRKGAVCYTTSYPLEPRPLLVEAGHLPWGYVLVCDEGVSGQDDHVCAQPGCSAPWDSLYALRVLYDSNGREQKNWSGDVRVRGFCSRHARRGNAELEDNDGNMILLDGPKPAPEVRDESPSVFGGVIKLDEEDEGV